MDLLLIVFLTLLNGVFAMSEMALSSVRKARLAAMEEAGDAGALAAAKLLEDPTRFLSTVQVGITSIGVLNGIVGEAAFSASLAHQLSGWGLTPSAAGVSATAIVVALITFTTIIFGELVPKRIGQLYPEAVARVVSRPMTWLASAAGPFVRLLSISTRATLKLLRIDTRGSTSVTEEEISASLEEGVDAGLIEEHEHQMVRNVFHLDDRPLTSMMTPRGDILWLDAALTVSEALAQINHLREQGSHSWYPVCKSGLEHVLGVVGMAQLLALSGDDGARLESLVQPALFMPETLTGMEVLEQLRGQSSRMLFVVDEYGEVQGLLTPSDLLEAITGELKPRTQTQAWATALPGGAWQLNGLMPIQELKARLGIKELPQEDRGRYNTLAGLLLWGLGHLPQARETCVLAGWQFTVEAMEGRRIDKVMARPYSQPDSLDTGIEISSSSNP